MTLYHLRILFSLHSRIFHHTESRNSKMRITSDEMIAVRISPVPGKKKDSASSKKKQVNGKAGQRKSRFPKTLYFEPVLHQIIGRRIARTVSAQDRQYKDHLQNPLRSLRNISSVFRQQRTDQKHNKRQYDLRTPDNGKDRHPILIGIPVAYNDQNAQSHQRNTKYTVDYMQSTFHLFPSFPHMKNPPPRGEGPRFPASIF